MRWIAIALLGLVGCGGDPAVAADATVDTGPMRPPETIGPSERPARFFSPAAHDGTTELPLVLLLHGYSADSAVQDLYFSLTRTARSEGFHLVLPDGTFDADGERHWDVLGTDIDDHAYLRALVEEATALVPVSAVFVLGHSNGGFMAYRLACDSADRIAGIATLAGSDVSATCTPAADVSILQIHGTADATVRFDGGTIHGLTYPAVNDLMTTWAARLGCTGTQAGADLDLVSNLDGAETSVTEHTGCRAGLALWAMEGADHIPSFTREFTPSVIAWLTSNDPRDAP